MTVEADTGKLPSYDRPPVIEVACSVMFPSLEGLLSPHIGLLWQRFQPEYPFCDDVFPIAQRVEIFDDRNLSHNWNSPTLCRYLEFGLSAKMRRELFRFSEIDLFIIGERLA